MSKELSSSVLYLVLAAIAISVASGVKESAVVAELPVGGATDSHGCLTGAGYSWSERLQECVRPWEAGTAAAAAEAQAAANAAAENASSNATDNLMRGRRSINLRSMNRRR